MLNPILSTYSFTRFYFVRVQLLFYTLQELESEEQRGKIAELEQTLKDRDEQEWKSGESTVTILKWVDVLPKICTLMLFSGHLYK